MYACSIMIRPAGVQRWRRHLSDFPSINNWKASLIWLKGSSWVMNSSKFTSWKNKNNQINLAILLNNILRTEKGGQQKNITIWLIINVCVWRGERERESTYPVRAFFDKMGELWLPFEVSEDRSHDSTTIKQLHWMKRKHPWGWMNS